MKEVKSEKLDQTSNNQTQTSNQTSSNNNQPPNQTNQNQTQVFDLEIKQNIRTTLENIRKKEQEQSSVNNSGGVNFVKFTNDKERKRLSSFTVRTEMSSRHWNNLKNSTSICSQGRQSSKM